MTGPLERGENEYAKQEWLSDTFKDFTEDVKTRGYLRLPRLLAKLEIV